MSHVNCSNFIIKNGRVFRRSGIPCDGFDENSGKIMINGLGMYRLFKKPAEIGDECTTDEEIASKFSDYRQGDPWIGRESDGNYYLYSGYLDKTYLYLGALSPKKPDVEYISVRAPMEYGVRILGNGRMIFRRFEGNDIVALVEIAGAAMIDLESDDGLIMLEALGQGRFVTR